MMMRPADASEIVSSTAEAAFASDEAGRIVLWNDAAERLLGVSAKAVMGKRCRDVLAGRDVFGNRFCRGRCALHEMVRRREAVHDFEIDVVVRNGGPRRVSVSVVAVHGDVPNRYAIVHIVKPSAGGVARAVPNAEHPDTGASGDGDGGGDGHDLSAPGALSDDLAALLTPRELQVLSLLSAGTETDRIAASLCISTTTVRNHIQHILQKLKVHTKVQAVALALNRRPS